MCHVGTAPLDEAEGCPVEVWRKDGLQEPSQDFLCNPVSDHWNAEGAEFGLFSVFGNVDPPQRMRHKGAALEFTQERPQMIREISLEHLDADSIDPGCASVAFDRLEGFAQQAEIDSSDQGVNLHRLAC